MAEATRRRAARGAVAAPASSRSYASIVRANTLTVFNLILVALATPPARDFFALAAPNANIIAVAVGGTLLSLFALALSGYTPGAASSLTPPPSAEQPPVSRASPPARR